MVSKSKLKNSVEIQTQNPKKPRRNRLASYLDEVGEVLAGGRLGKEDAVSGERGTRDVAGLDGEQGDAGAGVADGEADEGVGRQWEGDLAQLDVDGRGVVWLGLVAPAVDHAVVVAEAGVGDEGVLEDQPLDFGEEELVGVGCLLSQLVRLHFFVVELEFLAAILGNLRLVDTKRGQSFCVRRSFEANMLSLRMVC